MIKSYRSPNFANIPQELQDVQQWVCWLAVPDGNGKKPRKIPINPNTGTAASPSNKTTWASYADAVKFFEAHTTKLYTTANGSFTGAVKGVGFVLSENDYFTGIDLDNCIDENGNIEAWAIEIIDNFNSYTEISPSGHGLHIFVKGHKPEGRSRKGKIEIYSRDRFITITGVQIKDRCK